MVSGSNTIQAQYAYDPWGRATKLQGAMEADFQYAGYYRHARSGLNLTMFRAYSPNLGRWISKDPIGEEGGLNLYGYVANCPLDFSDPYGLVNWAQVFTGVSRASLGMAMMLGAAEFNFSTGGLGAAIAAGAMVNGWMMFTHGNMEIMLGLAAPSDCDDNSTYQQANDMLNMIPDNLLSASGEAIGGPTGKLVGDAGDLLFGQATARTEGLIGLVKQLVSKASFMNDNVPKDR